MTPELCGSAGVDSSGRRQQKAMAPVTTFALILFVTIVFPLLVMTAVTWLISAAYDERPLCGAAAAGSKRPGSRAAPWSEP